MESERGKRGGGGAGGFLGDLAELVRRLAELGESASGLQGQQGSQGGREFELPGGAKGVYGFTVRSGLSREGSQAPVVNKFGNVKINDEGTAVVSDTREPLVDVFDEGDELVLVAELPGVKDEDIELVVRGDIVELAAHGAVQKFRSETLLPTEVAAEPVSRTCENGYLQLRLAKQTTSADGHTVDESNGE